MENLTSQAIEKILTLGRTSTEQFDHPSGGKGVIIPKDFEVAHLKPIDPVLTHVSQRVTMLDTGSFNAYVNKFKGEEGSGKCTIFADYTKPKIEARINYHEPAKPDFNDHIVLFSPPWSEQWARWRAIDEKGLAQVTFAEFIEENMQDIVTPAGAVFLDLVTGLQAKKKVTFESGIRLQDGSNQLVYSEDVEGKGRNNMTVPSEFEIGVPIFFGGAPYKVRCFLRYRIDEGKLVFAIKINRRLFTEQTAFADITQEITEATGLLVLNGTI